MKKIADVAEVTSGQSPPGSSYNQEGIGMEFHQGKKYFGDSSLKTSGVWTTEVTRKAQPGDIIMSVRAPVGPINYVEREVCIGRGLASIRATDAVNRGFLAKFLLMNEGRINGHAGATFNSINKKEIEEIPLPVPPMEEQERIVEILDQAFEAIDKAKANIERNLANARELFQSRLNEVFSNPPADWEVKPLGEVFSFQGGTQPPKSKFIYEPKQGYVRLLQIRDFSRDDKKVFIPEKSSTRRCDAKDVLIGRYGASVGKICSGLSGSFNVALVKVVPKTPVNPRYYQLFFESPEFQRPLADVSSRGAQDGFNVEGIKDFSFLMPPFDEQEQIVNELGKLSILTKGIESKYQSQLNNLEELRQSILEQAFEGKLTEPATA